MIRFFVYINNKPKTNNRFLFCATVRLTEPCPPLPTGTSTSPNRDNYIGRCQLCDIIGYSTRYCQYLSSSALATLPPLSPHGSCPNYVSPFAHTSTYPTTPPATYDCILDSRGSHHVTTDLVNLELNSPYTTPDNVINGDGIGLAI